MACCTQISELYIKDPPSADVLCLVVDCRLTELVLEASFPATKSCMYNFSSETDVFVHSILKSLLRSSQITKITLPNITPEVMAGVCNILLHCPSLATFQAKLGMMGSCMYAVY